MSLLEEFEEKEEKVEMSVEEYVKTLIEESFSKYSQEVNSLHEIAKTKTAEMILEFTKIQELKKKTEEYHQESEDILKTMVENSEKFTKIFEKKLNEIKDTNQIFQDTLKNSGIVENLQRILQSNFDAYSKATESSLIQLSEHSERAINNIDRRLSFRNKCTYGVAGLFVIILVALVISFYNIREEVSTYQKEISIVKEIMRENKKYWYDEKNQKIYIGDKKELEEKNKKK